MERLRALERVFGYGHYLFAAKDGKMVVKTESTENRDLTNIAGAAFTVTVTYDAGARCLAVRLTNADGVGIDHTAVGGRKTESFLEQTSFGIRRQCFSSNHGEYDYQWKADGTACMLALSLGNGMYATYSDSRTDVLRDTPSVFFRRPTGACRRLKYRADVRSLC